MAEQRKISIGPLIGLAGGVLLFVSLFLDWYDGLTAFTVFEVLDLVLALLAIGAVVSLAESLGVRLPSGVASRAGLGLPFGAVALLIIVSQLINDPPAIVGSGRGPELGMWLGLAGTLLIVAGGLLAVARISLALDLEGRGADARRRERAAPPVGSEAPTTPVPGAGAEADPGTAEPPTRRGERPAPDEGPERRG